MFTRSHKEGFLRSVFLSQWNNTSSRDLIIKQQIGVQLLETIFSVTLHRRVSDFEINQFSKITFLPLYWMTKI